MTRTEREVRERNRDRQKRESRQVKPTLSDVKVLPKAGRWRLSSFWRCQSVLEKSSPLSQRSSLWYSSPHIWTNLKIKHSKPCISPWSFIRILYWKCYLHSVTKMSLNYFDDWLLWELREICKVTQVIVQDLGTVKQRVPFSQPIKSSSVRARALTSRKLYCIFSYISLKENKPHC